MKWNVIEWDELNTDALRLLVKNTAIIFSIVFMITMTWDAQRTDASVVGGAIPEESIRLRILPNLLSIRSSPLQ